MDAQQFLDFVLAEDGYTCLWSKKGRSVKQLFFTDKQEVLDTVKALDSDGYDVYFACAKYETNKDRKAGNAKYFKSVWLDIDCGKQKFEEGKGYQTQADALVALRDFCTRCKIPKPTIVSSGNGIHCYWVLDKTINYNLWYPLAEALKKICVKEKLVVDLGVVADAARILRIPGTSNHKDPDNLKQVSVIHNGKPYTLVKLQETFLGEVSPTDIFGDVVGTVDDTTKSLFNGTPSKCKFSKIMKLSALDKGCAQLMHCYKNAGTIGYDLWLAALSIAQHCVDNTKAIHMLSKDHDDYDPANALFKASEMKGPRLCKNIELLNPGGCDTCIHRGQISTPLLLGRFTEEATPEDNVLNVTHKGLNMPVVNIIPELPYPYYRRKEGGVMLRAVLSTGKEDIEDDKLIYAHDLYVDKRLRDPDDGEMVVIKHILPNDGLEEFTTPLSSIMSRDRAQTVLATHGVALPLDQIKFVVEYIIKSVQQLQKDSVADVARAQFGWCDKDSAFVVGTRQITENKIVFSPPSSATRNVVERFQTSGTLENWIEIANLYGRPGQEARAFILGMGFGAPLLKYSGVSGFIVHITNQGSGQGKTTAQYMINSIWGNPKEATLLIKDKELARQNHFGTLQHIPSTVDEITNLTPEQASEMALMITDGRGRDRMMSQTNSVRKNNSTWRAPCITSGNSSLHSLLLKNKSFPEGELLRVLEIKLEKDRSLTKMEGDKYFGSALFENYGHACEPLMQYMIENLQECKDLFFANREAFDKRVSFESKHRFYSNACATSFTGLEIAKTLGLIDIDVEQVRAWAAKTLFATLSTIKEADVDEMAILNEYVSQNMDSLVIVNGVVTNNLQHAAILTPRAKAVARYEPDTGILAINTSAFNNWCTDKQICVRTLMTRLSSQGIFIDRKNIRVTTGTLLPPVTVRCYVFNYEMKNTALAA